MTKPVRLVMMLPPCAHRALPTTEVVVIGDEPRIQHLLLLSEKEL